MRTVSHHSAGVKHNAACGTHLCFIEISVGADIAQGHHRTMHRRIFASAVALTLLTACSGTGEKHGSMLRPVTSKPPASAIVLSSPVAVKAMNGTATFPAGEYRPMYEGGRGFYFESTSQVTFEDVATYGYEGGLYVAHGSTEAARWYMIRGEKPVSGKFKVIPAHTIVP